MEAEASLPALPLGIGSGTDDVVQPSEVVLFVLFRGVTEDFPFVLHLVVCDINLFCHFIIVNGKSSFSKCFYSDYVLFYTFSNFGQKQNLIADFPQFIVSLCDDVSTKGYFEKPDLPREG